MKYTDELLVLAEEETVVQDMIDTLNELENESGNECRKN